MPRNILKPGEPNRIKATCYRSAGNKAYIYYFKSEDEINELTKDVPDFRCSIEFLPLHRAKINNFTVKDGSKELPGDYYLGPVGQDDGFKYSAEIYVVEEVPSPLLNSYVLSNHINHYLITLNTKPVNLDNAMHLTISTLNDDGVEVYIIVSKFISNEETWYSPNVTSVKELAELTINKYAEAFCTMFDYKAVVQQIANEIDESKEIRCHCEDCKHDEDHA